MKKIVLMLALILGFNAFSQAQEIKMGYTNVDYIIAFMPETQIINGQINAYEQQLANNLRGKFQEFQQKSEEYQSGAAMMVDEVRQQKETELQNLQTELQQLEASSPQLLQQKQAELLQPLYTLIQGAIDEVAAEEGFTVIFRSENLLFADDSLVEVSDMIFAKLGITPPAAE
jgi:outer membrane protein